MENFPKYVTDIKNRMALKLTLIPKITSELTEHQQNYSDNVLNVYREAFSTLIENVVTCKDILIAVREAYENALGIRDQRIKLFITQARVFGISSAKRKFDKDFKNIIDENSFLKKKCEDANRELAKTKAEMEKLRLEMHSDHNCLMGERDARYTLFFENVELQMKLKQLDGSDDVRDTSYNDPVVLKIALEKCREQLTLAHKKLSTMSDEYAETVPRRDYDALEIQHVELKKSLEKAGIEHQTLLEKHKRVLKENQSLKEEISDLKERCSDLERAGTPRPQWEICADFIGGGGERWRQLQHGLPSREILRVILKELGPSAKTDNLEYFDGLGNDPVIPPYLRYDGKVRNLRLSRREISVIINDIWMDKMNNGIDISMQDFVTLYFENRYQQASVRAEWAYNLVCGSEQMLDDPQIKLFWGVLQGHLSEDIYLSHRREWYLYRDNLLKQCHDEIISVDKFEKVSKATFPLKSEVDIKNLLDLARKQLKLKTTNTEIDIGKLFQENEEGFDRSEFAKELYRQRQIAQDKYIKEIIAELGGKNTPNKLITVENLKRAFALTDPAIDHIRMEKHVRWAFSDKKSDLNMIYPLPLKALAAKLAAGNIERAGPRDIRAARRVRKIVKH